MNVFEIEKQIMQAKHNGEADDIIANLNDEQLRSIIKMLLCRINEFRVEHSIIVSQLKSQSH